MKKPNRIARKGDTARSRAQAKRRASAPAKPRRPSPRKRTAAKPPKPKPSREAIFAAATGLAESPHGEYVCEVELDAGTWQTLYRRGENEFTLVDTCVTVHDGRYWRTWEEWSEFHPGVLLSSLPRAKVRRKDFPEKLHRGEVIAWLWDHLDSVAIPADFAEDFRPLRIVSPAAKAEVRESFFVLAQSALKAANHTDDMVSAAIDIRNVGMALGLKDEAAEAATIVSANNALHIAANTLDSMLDARLDEKRK